MQHDTDSQACGDSYKQLVGTAIALSIYSTRIITMTVKIMAATAVAGVVVETFSEAIAHYGMLHNTTAQFHYWYTKVIN
jgi:hypothetical protein